MVTMSDAGMQAFRVSSTHSLCACRPQVLTSAHSDDCSVFVAPDGNIQEVMCCDYGFRSGFGRLYQGGDGEIPKNALALVNPSPGPSYESNILLVLFQAF